MPLLRKKRVLAAKVEATTGTAETLAAADATFNVYDLKAEPMIDFERRDGQGAALSKIAGVAGAKAGKFSFKIPLIGGSTMPAWGSTFLPAVGFYGAALAWSPESKPPEAASAHTKTITLGAYIDGKLKSIYGAMGNCVFNFPVGKMAYAAFEFTGLWVAPSNVTLLAPTYDTTAPLKTVSGAVAIGSFNPKCSNITIDLGNTVALREDPNTAAGYHSAVITDRAPKGTMDPEETLTGTHGAAIYDADADYVAATLRALAITLGTAGNGLAFAAPKLQISASPTDDDRNGLQVASIQFDLLKSASAGDDELVITFS